MNIEFIYRNFESIGIEVLSAYLKLHGHNVKLVYDPSLFNFSYVKLQVLDRIFSYTSITLKRILSEPVDLLAFSVTSDDYEWCCYIAQEVKKVKPTIPIVFGGIHPTLSPEEVIKLPYVDFICVGEGEEALLELADRLERNETTDNILNIWTRRNGEIMQNTLRPLLKNLDNLPFPDKELFYSAYKGFSANFYSMISTRGCVHRCSYCYNNYVGNLYNPHKTYVRRRSVDSVINELQIAKEKYSIKRVSFYDDIFTYDKNWLREFSDKYQIEIGLPYFCFTHPSYVDEEIVNLLSKSNCYLTALGIQTMSERLRRNVLNRQDTNEEISKAINLIGKSSIFLSVSLILGIPLQTEQDLEETLLFFKQKKIDHIHFLWLRYYPQMEIVTIARKANILTDRQVSEIEEGKNVTGYEFNKDMSKFVNIFLFGYSLPDKLLRFIFKRKLHKKFPELFSSHLLFLYHEFKVLLFFGLRKILSRKENFTNSGPKFIFNQYMYFMVKKIRYVLTGSLS